MKRLILVFVLVLSTALPSQVDTTFSELRGMDDSSGSTHLFYRKYSYQDLNGYWKKHNDVYHFDLAAQSDTLMFEDHFYNTSISFGGQTTNDFEFWNNDPSKYIAGGSYAIVDPDAYFWHYDSGEIYYSLGEIFTIEISHQNDSLLYAYQAITNEGLIKSTDGGYNWFADPNAAPYFFLIEISPFDDHVFFSTKGGLYKSIDRGINYTLVDSSIYWGGFGDSYLFFDPDSFHIYSIMHAYNQSYFLRSADAGDSWDLLNSSSDKMHLSIDPSQSGAVFLSDSNEIKMSNDYGTTFTPHWQFTRQVVGLYKKPDSDILYAATTKDIYQVTPTDTVSLKHLSTVVSVDDGIPPIARRFELHQNYPNPFNPATTIGFDLPKASQIKIEVFSITGEKVATIFEGQKAAGYHTVEFDAGALSSGVYLYRLTAGRFAKIRKLVLLK